MTLDEKIGQMSQSTSMATPLSESIKDSDNRASGAGEQEFASSH